MTILETRIEWRDTLELCRRCGRKTDPKTRFRLNLSSENRKLYLCSPCGSGAQSGAMRVGNEDAVAMKRD